MKRAFVAASGCAVLLVGGVISGYVALYVLARSAKMIVHVRNDSCSWNDVIAGDGKLASPNPIVAAIFTPLRIAESEYWRRHYGNNPAQCP